MRRIFGIGETVYDILFRDGQPIAAVPGGSVFNGLISLGRTGMQCTFISEVGADRVGGYILDFIR
ncbi:MAG: carbohydrate kinase, partial [Bacteroidaceae bacterium]|nr:carbohydrate kinase [Bacteroidaceae bacterium]